ncbi:MAG: addiction module protein [Thiobacillaceae bacterium]
MSKSLLDEVSKLPLAERIQSVGDIWDTIAKEAVDLPLHDWQREELEQALAEYRAAPDQAEDWEVVRARLIRSL